MIYTDLSSDICGERGIRTPGTVARTPHFECGPIDHSGISPIVSLRPCGNLGFGTANIHIFSYSVRKIPKKFIPDAGFFDAGRSMRANAAGPGAGMTGVACVSTLEFACLWLHCRRFRPAKCGRTCFCPRLFVTLAGGVPDNGRLALPARADDRSEPAVRRNGIY